MMYVRGPCDEGLHSWKPSLSSTACMQSLAGNNADETSPPSSTAVSHDNPFLLSDYDMHDSTEEAQMQQTCSVAPSCANQLCVYNNMAKYWYERGEVDQASKALHCAMDTIKQFRKQGATIYQHDDNFQRIVSSTVSNIGHVHFAKGELDLALYYAIEALHSHQACRDNDEDEDDLFRATLFFNIGHLMQLLDHPEGEAEEALKRSLHILENIQVTPGVVGRKERVLVTVKSLLFTMQTQKCSTTSMDDALFQLYLTERSLHGYDHGPLARILCDLGTFYMRDEQHEEASHYLKEALRIQRHAKAPENDMFLTLTELGHCLQTTGKQLEAMHYFREALRLKGNTIRRESDQLKTVFAAVLYNIGMIQSVHGEGTRRVRRARALQFFGVCLELRKDVLGLKHPAVASTLHNIGVLLLEEGQVARSMECFRQSLNIRRVTFGRNHPDIASSLHHMGRIHQDRGEYQDALRLYSEAHSVLQIISPQGDEQLVEVLMGLGQAQHSLGQLDEALVSYEHAAQLLRERQQQGQVYSTRYMARIFTVMGNLSLDMSDLAAANAFFNEAAATVASSGDPRAVVVVPPALMLMPPCAPAA